MNPSDLVSLAESLKSKGVKRFEHETNKGGGKLTFEFFESLQTVEVEVPKTDMQQTELALVQAAEDTKRGLDGLTAEQQVAVHGRVLDQELLER